MSTIQKLVSNRPLPNDMTEIRNFFKGEQANQNFDVLKQDRNVANQNNTIEVHIASSYKISDFNISDLPMRVYEVCKHLQLLELEYIVPHSIAEGKFLFRILI